MRSVTKGETYKELTSSDITKDALLILKARNIECWRQNNLTVRKRKGIVHKGVSDIVGYNKSTGQALFVEVKKIGDVLSDEQILFLSKAYTAKCICLIATQKRGETVLIDFKEYLD